jgi:hypothetical protein
MNWQIFKAIYELYELGVTRIRPSLATHPFIQYHTRQIKELYIGKKNIEVVAKESFRARFEKQYQQKYVDCKALLQAINEDKPQCRLEVEDILVLKDLKERMESGDLQEIRQQIIQFEETRRGVSLMFFKNEKHLEGSETLERAVKNILQIDDFADDRDAQYLYILHCLQPRLVVLCENLHFLKMPEIPRRHQVELWYAGGKNIEKLNYIPQTSLPIYYICDWDHDGLGIYRAVKNILPAIQLLTPHGEPRSIVKTDHKSFWEFADTPSRLSGLPPELFSETQKRMIEDLVISNSWIIEESNNLLQLLSSRG